MAYQLLIGNQNYSSWSLRPWLLLKGFDIPFEERLLKFDTVDFKRTVAQYSGAGQVPILIDGDVVVWDSLAIAEYLAERHAGLWPSDATARAMARCFCAEMHAGFRALRNKWPMSVRSDFPLKPDDDIAKDIARIEAIWSAARRRSRAHGPFLFGDFSIADAYFAPVVFRFRTYHANLNEHCRDYMQTMLAHPAMRAWDAAARAEPEVVEYDDPAHLYAKQ
jgi:glutathione S-transferase